MQLTMNQVETYATTAKTNSLFDVFKTVAKKIATALTPAKKVKWSNATVAEVIEYIEWRTRFDQQRIVNHVYILAALAQSQELCSALGIKEPTYKSKFFGINNRSNNRVYADYAGHTASVEPVDRFDLLLRKFTGYGNPRVQALMSGGIADAAVYRSLDKRLEDIVTYKGDDIEILSLQHNVLAQQRLSSPRAQIVISSNAGNVQTATLKPQSYEDVILSMMRQLIDGIESRLVVEQLVLEAATPIVTIDVIATEIIKEEEEVTSVTTPLEVTDEQLIEVARPVQAKTRLSKKMTIKELKAYAKERNIQVPGRKTKHRDIYEFIKETQQSA